MKRIGRKHSIPALARVIVLERKLGDPKGATRAEVFAQTSSKPVAGFERLDAKSRIEESLGQLSRASADLKNTVAFLELVLFHELADDAGVEAWATQVVDIGNAVEGKPQASGTVGAHNGWRAC